MKSRLTSESYLVIIPMLLLTLIGIIAIASVSSRPGGTDGLFESGPIISRSNLVQLIAYQPVKQTIFALLGLLLFALIIRWNYYGFRNYSYVLYIGLLICLVLLLFVGKYSYGARRWIYFGSFAFQPSEFMKIITVLLLAQYLMHRTSITKLSGLIIPFLLALLPLVLILLQPDLGTSFVFLPVLFLMVYVAGARVKYLVMTVLIGILFMPVAYFWLMKDYQKARLQIFLNPSKSPTADGYHLLQSRIAVGTGGLLGSARDAEEPLPSIFVPARHNDFIFTVIAEKWGFVGAAFVLLLYFIIFATFLCFAGTIREPYGRLIIVGITAYLIMQVIVNIGMTIGLAPITGITLPLVSYGGSSLTSTYIAMGFIVNIRLKQMPSFSSRDFV
ncbi:MAG: rod shape-determining protein RodA [Planctomycetota bacterium]|nr:rod shape-determining protein RodA [Planctomycetota bacterium]